MRMLLPEALAELAARAGTAVADGAGARRWESFGRGVADWFARWGGGDPAAEFERLAATALALRGSDADAGAGAGAGTGALARQAGVWTARVEALLEELAEDERERAAAELSALLTGAARGVTAVAGDMRVSARGGGVAAGVVQGDVTIGHPRMPAPPQA